LSALHWSSSLAAAESEMAPVMARRGNLGHHDVQQLILAFGELHALGARHVAGCVELDDVHARIERMGLAQRLLAQRTTVDAHLQIAEGTGVAGDAQLELGNARAELLHQASSLVACDAERLGVVVAGRVRRHAAQGLLSLEQLAGLLLRFAETESRRRHAHDAMRSLKGLERAQVVAARIALVAEAVERAGGFFLLFAVRFDAG
jgi:hypothetical protein